jgi:hypothetical protein
MRPLHLPKNKTAEARASAVRLRVPELLAIASIPDHTSSDQFGILHFCQCLSWSFSTIVATVFIRYSLPSLTASWR